MLALANSLSVFRSLSAAAPVGGASLQVDWTDESVGEQGFRIEWSLASDFDPLVSTATVGENVETYTITGLLYNQLYYVRVYAFSEAGDSEALNGSGTTVPDVPTDLEAAQGTGSEVDLTWSAPTGPTSGATSYKVEYKLTSEPTTWTEFATGVTDLFDTVTGLTGETSYDFRVRGTNAGGDGGYSNTETIVTGEAAAVPQFYNSYDEDYTAWGTTALENTWTEVQKVALPAGDVLTLRLWIAFVNAATDLYLGLYDSSGNEIVSGNATVTSGNDQWHEVAVTPTAISAGDYFVSISQNGGFNGALTMRSSTGGTSGDSKISYSVGYAAWPFSGFGAFSNGTARLPVGVEI